MRRKTILILITTMVIMLGIAGAGYPAHEEKGAVKGAVTEIKIVEVELTVKDDKGKETKVKTKDPAAFKIGDKVVIRDGKVSKEVKPITGGY